MRRLGNYLVSKGEFFKDRSNGAAYLPVSTRGFMTAFVMHGLTVKLGAMFRRSLAASGELAMVALTIVEAMIDVPVEVT
jgi:hypothetical protein